MVTSRGRWIYKLLIVELVMLEQALVEDLPISSQLATTFFRPGT